MQSSFFQYVAEVGWRLHFLYKFTSISHIIKISDYIKGLEWLLSDDKIADVNRDGKVDIKDVDELSRIIH